jgi:hypothetical protein
MVTASVPETATADAIEGPPLSGTYRQECLTPQESTTNEGYPRERRQMGRQKKALEMRRFSIRSGPPIGCIAPRTSVVRVPLAPSPGNRMAMRLSALGRMHRARDFLATWLEYPVGAWLESHLCHGAGFGFVERFPAVEPAVPPVYEESRLFAPRAKPRHGRPDDGLKSLTTSRVPIRRQMICGAPGTTSSSTSGLSTDDESAGRVG